MEQTIHAADAAAVAAAARHHRLRCQCLDDGFYDRRLIESNLYFKKKLFTFL